VSIDCKSAGLAGFVSRFAICLQYAGGVDKISPCSHWLRQPVTSMRHMLMAGEFVSARQVALAAWPMCVLQRHHLTVMLWGGVLL
jgi:hypothetical protein